MLALYSTTIWSKSLPFYSRKKFPTQQPGPVLGPVCTWSAHAPQPGLSPLPLPCHDHSLTATATPTGENFLFGGFSRIPYTRRSICAINTRFFYNSLANQWRCSHPTAHMVTRLSALPFLIYGGSNTNSSDQNALSSDSLCFLNLGTSDLLMTSPTPADDSFVLQNRENGSALWSIVLGPILVCIIPQPWLVPSSLSSVVRSARIFR